MPAKIRVLPLWSRVPPRSAAHDNVSTVSNARGWMIGLSPFVLGPCKLYKRYVSRVMENAWQYSKVYEEYVAFGHAKPSTAYWGWAKEGWANRRAVRYPMGKGRAPEFSWWDGRRLTYVEARKAIYGPLYIEAVLKTEAYARLKNLYKTKKTLNLLDYDAYDHRESGVTLADVLNDPNRKMGHAFVLMMLLTNDRALKQMELR